MKVEHMKNNFKIVQDYLIDFEGYKNKTYRLLDEPFLTVGIGHKITNNELYTLPRKEHEYVEDYIIQELFIKDIQNAVSLAKDIYPNYEQHTNNVRIFMVLQAFNMGNNLRSFVNSNQHIIDFNYGLAYEGFMKSKWAKQVHEHRATKTCNLLFNKVE